MSVYLRMSYDPNPNYELYGKAATLAKTLNYAFDTSVCVYPPDKYNTEMYDIHFNGDNLKTWGILVLLEEAGIPLEERSADIRLFHKDYMDLLLTYIKMRGYKIHQVTFDERN